MLPISVCLKPVRPCVRRDDEIDAFLLREGIDVIYFDRRLLSAFEFHATELCLLHKRAAFVVRRYLRSFFSNAERPYIAKPSEV